MIVVSNTSPLTNLAAIGQFDLLQSLYGNLYIADGVWDELNARGQKWMGRDEVASATWVTRQTVKNQDLVVALTRDLDRGEAESIALALELHADLLLLDEKDGRRVAQRLNLRVMGVLGVLLDGKSQGAILQIAPYLTALRQTAGFYLSDSLIAAVLDLAGEAG